MKKIDFTAIAARLIEADRLTQKHLSEDKMRFVKDLAENEMLLKLMPLLKADEMTTAKKRSWIKEQEGKIKKWEGYKKKKKIINSYLISCRCDYLLREFFKAKSHFGDRNSQEAWRAKIKKIFPKSFLKGGEDVKAIKGAGNRSN